MKLKMKVCGLFLGLSLVLCGLSSVAFGQKSNSALAADSSFSLVFKTGSGDGSLTDTSTAASTAFSTGASNVSGNFITVNRAYLSSSGGLKLGASGKAGELKFSLDKTYNVKSVVVNAVRYNSGKSSTLSVNGETAQSLTASSADYTFNVSGNCNYIDLNTNNYSFIASLIVTYVDGASSVPSISINANSTNQSIQVGSNFTYSATKTNADSASIVWSSSDTSVATINSSTGVATGVSFGTTTITATITVGGVDYSDSTTLNVLYAEPSTIENASLASIVSNTEGNLKRKFTTTAVIKGWGTNGTDATPGTHGNMVVTDGTTDLICYGCTGGDATKITWDGENNTYVYTGATNFKTLSLTQNLKIGDRINFDCVRADYNTTVEVNAKITSVTVNELDSIEVTPIKTEYTQGDSIQAADFSVVGTYTVAGEQAISSSDCTISPSTLNTAGDAITVTITYQGKSDTYNVKVNAAVHDLTDLIIVESDFTLLSTDAPKQLTLAFEPSNTTEAIVWESSNTSVATVSDSGLVSYVAPGTATITVKGEKNVCSDSITVTCRRGALASAEFTDVLDLESTGVTVSSYTEFSNISLNSPAKFSGRIIAATKPNLGSIQLNKFNGAIWTTSSGGNIKSITVDFMNANSNTLNVYGSNDAYTSRVTSDTPSGTVLGSLTENGTISVTGSYKYIYIFTNATMYVNSLSFVWDSSKYATISDLDALDAFMGNKLYMETYNSDLGYCADAEHHYYADAKQAFNNLTADQRAYFLNDTVNTQYADAKARLMKWAEINGDELDSTDNTLGMRNSMNQLSNASNTAVALAIAMISVLSLTAVLYLRKKKLLSK